MRFYSILIVCALLNFASSAQYQIPVEFFAGQKRATADIMFFQFFKNKEKENTPWLFFNRNRASVPYPLGHSLQTPLFGFTEALSYNAQKLKGFAPVAVLQILSNDVSAKAGIQYARVKERLTIFSWLVSETKSQGNIDFFLLTRYTPRLTDRLDLFTQLETLNQIPTSGYAIYSFTQRLRLGLQYHRFQIGLGADWTQFGKNSILKSQNNGLFIRHQF